jgi:hypothetical protein
LVEAIGAFVELGAEASERAAVAGGQLALVGERAKQALEPGLRRTAALERVEHCADVVRVAGNRRLDELVLGLEVVLDVADRHVGRPRDVRNRCRLDALLMEQLARAGDQTVAFSLVPPCG